MGSILSNFSKIDTIINPESEAYSKNIKEDNSVISDNSTKNIQDTEKIETETGSISKELTSEKIIESIVNKGINEEKLREELIKESSNIDGRKIEVNPINLSDTSDVIRRPLKRHKYNHA